MTTRPESGACPPIRGVLADAAATDWRDPALMTPPTPLRPGRDGQRHAGRGRRRVRRRLRCRCASAPAASVWQTCAMSLLVFTGASQFSAVSVIGAGGTTAAALGGALILAARNGVYGLAMSRVVGGSLATRLLAAQLTIDESTAMATAQTDPTLRRTAFWVTGGGDLPVLEPRHARRRPRRVGDRPRDVRASTLRSRPASWRWSPRTCATASAAWRGALGAAICLVLIPFVPVGVPDPVRLRGRPRRHPRRTEETIDLPGTAGVP